MAGTIEGYTATLCTMYGQETVFIAFEDNQEKTDTSCYKCPACINQAKSSAWMGSYRSLIDTRYVLDSRVQIEPLYLAPPLAYYSRFLSRAPPV